MSKPTLLVIDDHPEIREMLAEYLTDLGFEVETARDGEEGLRRIDAGGIDMAIVDLMMPRVNGYEVAATLRERETERLPFILISAYNTGSWDSAKTLGAVAGFGKPLDLAALEATIRATLTAAGKLPAADAAA